MVASCLSQAGQIVARSSLMLCCSRTVLEPAALARRGRIGRCARIADGAVDHEPVPDEQDDQRADGRGDEARALIDPVPADGLADEGGEECAGNSEQRGQDEARRVVRSRRQNARDDAGDEADEDDPEDPDMTLSRLTSGAWLRSPPWPARRAARRAATEWRAVRFRAAKLFSAVSCFVKSDQATSCAIFAAGRSWSAP